MAVAVAGRVQVESIRLIETGAKQSLLKGQLPTQLAIAVQTSHELHAEEHLIDIHAKFSLVGRYKESEKSEPPLGIRAEFVIRYSLGSSEGLTKSHYDAFAELNGSHNAWPYWREYVQSVTTRMGIPPLTIPVYRVVAAGSPLLESRSTRQIASALTPKRKRQARKNRLQGSLTDVSSVTLISSRGGCLGNLLGHCVQQHTAAPLPTAGYCQRKPARLARTHGYIRRLATVVPLPVPRGDYRRPSLPLRR